MADIQNAYHIYGNKDKLKSGTTFKWRDIQVGEDITAFAEQYGINPDGDKLKMFIGYHKDNKTLMEHINSQGETIEQLIKAFYKKNPTLDGYQNRIDDLKKMKRWRETLITMTSINTYQLDDHHDASNFIYIDNVELDEGRDCIEISFEVKAVNVRELEVHAKKEVLLQLVKPEDLTHQHEVDKSAYYSQYH